MINHHTLRFDAGYESAASLPPPHALRAALKSGDPDSVRAELQQLLDQAQAGQLTSAGLLDAMLSQDADGSTAWHEICQRGGPAALGHVLKGVSQLTAAGRLSPAEACGLFRAGGGIQMPALHLHASKANPRELHAYGDTLLALHHQGQLGDAELASVLLQDWHGETLLQCALNRNNDETLTLALGLLAAAVKSGAITPADVCNALNAPRFTGYPLDADSPPAGNAPSPLQVAFATAAVPLIKAVIKGVDALRQTGRMSAAPLREVMEPVFQSTGSALLQPSGVMAKDLAQAKALVAQARERWFAAGPGTADTTTAR